MRVTLLLCAALLAAGTVDGSPAGELDLSRPLHPSIRIVGDGGFDAPGSGVRSGAGSADDPYVIARWTVLHSGVAAIRLENTTAHVVIEDVLIPGVAGSLTGAADCLTGYCDNAIGIFLWGASNVTVRNVRVLDAGSSAVIAKESHDVTIADSHFGWAGSPTQPSLYFGIGLVDAERILVRNVTIESDEYPLSTRRVSNLTIEGSRLDGLGLYLVLADARDVVLRGNTIRNASVYLMDVVSRLSIVDNAFGPGRQGVQARGDGTPRVDDLVICGNSFERHSAYSVTLRNAVGVEIDRNRFVDTYAAIEVQMSMDVAIRENLVTGTSHRIGLLSLVDAQVHGNSFFGNPGGLYAGDPRIDATLNWWGDARGPLGHEGSTGDPLHTSGAAVPYLPVLASAPAIPSAC